MLRALKLLVLNACCRSGLTWQLAASRWRRQRLLILCYHGISLDDEHEWDGRLFMPPALFRRRLQRLHQLRYAVLPLREALARLYEGTLPPRAVCLTFDDGFAGFHRLAWPMLREYAWPATLYLTTYYSLYNRPVFDPAVPYLLWKSRQRALDFPPVLSDQLLLDQRGRAAAERQIKAYSAAQRLSGADKDELLLELARRLEIDLAEMSSRRVMHLVSPAEVRELASQGVDVQLHTHTHLTMREREQCHQEIQKNRQHIVAMTGAGADHLSYPNGVHFPEMRLWLRECGVLSASTTEPGLSTGATDAWALPRFLDGCPVTRVEFEGWLSGVATFLPRRPLLPVDAQGREP